VFSGPQGVGQVPEVEVVGRIDAHYVDVVAIQQLAVVRRCGQSLVGMAPFGCGQSVFARIGDGTDLQPRPRVFVDPEHVASHTQADDADSDVLRHLTAPALERMARCRTGESLPAPFPEIRRLHWFPSAFN